MNADLKIAKYIEQHYPELAGCDLSIGLRSNVYRVMVLDPFHWLHTIKIARADIGE